MFLSNVDIINLATTMSDSLLDDNYTTIETEFGKAIQIFNDDHNVETFPAKYYTPMTMQIQGHRVPLTKTLPPKGIYAPMALAAALRYGDQRVFDIITNLKPACCHSTTGSAIAKGMLVFIPVLLALAYRTRSDKEKLALYSQLTVKGYRKSCLLYQLELNKALLAILLDDSNQIPDIINTFIDIYQINRLEAKKQFQQLFVILDKILGSEIQQTLAQFVRHDIFELTQTVVEHWFNSTSALNHYAAESVQFFMGNCSGEKNIGKHIGSHNIRELPPAIMFVLQFGKGSYCKVKRMFYLQHNKIDTYGTCVEVYLKSPSRNTDLKKNRKRPISIKHIQTPTKKSLMSTSNFDGKCLNEQHDSNIKKLGRKTRSSSDNFHCVEITKMKNEDVMTSNVISLVEVPSTSSTKNTINMTDLESQVVLQDDDVVTDSDATQVTIPAFNANDDQFPDAVTVPASNANDDQLSVFDNDTCLPSQADSLDIDYLSSQDCQNVLQGLPSYNSISNSLSSFVNCSNPTMQRFIHETPSKKSVDTQSSKATID